jgi:long-chain fatty acid transport protein
LAFDHFNEYSISAINPSAAMNFGSFAVGVSVNLMNIQHRVGFYQGYDGWEATEGAVGAYQVSIDEDAWAFGGTIGVQGNLTEKLRFGAFVKSTISAALEGEAKSSLFRVVDSTNTETTVSSDFELPWIFGLGFLYEFAPNFRVNVDAMYSLWGSTQTTKDYEYGNNIWNNRFENVDSLSGYTGGSFPLEYDNSFDVGIGLEYEASENVTVRCGYRYSQAQNTDETYSMLYPAIDQHWLSVGIGFWFEELYVDMAVAYGAGTQIEVSENKNPFYAGKYDGDTYIPTINIKYQF